MPATVFLGRLAVAVAVFTASYALGAWAAENNGGWASPDACPEDPTLSCGTLYAFLWPSIGATVAFLVLAGWHPERRPGEDTDDGGEVGDER